MVKTRIVIENITTGEKRYRTRDLTIETFFSLLTKIDTQENGYILKEVEELD